MADFFKGLAGGFGTGLQFGQAMRQRRMEDDLAQAYAKPETSQGYTAETGQQLEELAKTGAYDIVPQYAPAAEGQTQGVFTGYQAVPKAGLDLQGDMPAAPMSFNPQQVQDYGGRRVAGQFDPTQLRGLQMQEAARVLGSYGDVRGAAALQAQAEEQAYQAKYRPLQLQQVEGQIAGQAQQRELTGLQLDEGKRTATQRQNYDNFTAFAAENPDMSVAELKENAFKQFKFTPKQWQDTVATRLQIETGEMDSFKNSVKKKLQGKNLNQLGELYNSDPDFDDKTDLAIVPGKGGAVTLNFIDKATGRVTTSETFKSQALATEYLNKQATEPETIGSWMMNLQKAELGMDKDRAAIEASKATTANARQEKLSPLEKNLAALQRLGVKVSPEEVKSMAGVKAPALSPEAAAQIEIITASLKDNSSPANIEAARAAVTDIFRGEGLKQRNTTIVNGLRTAAGKNDLPTAVKQLQDAGVANETIVGLARQAGVSIPAELLPPAPVPQTGLNTNAPRQPIQLLAPLNAIGDYRRRMIEEQQAAGGSGGLVNPAGF